jgi:Family of unknown function (DUF6132)
MNKKKWTFRLISAAIGAALGFAYYYFIGCSTGTCPLTSNPYIMIAYGSVFGLLLAPTPKIANQETQPETLSE